MNTNKIILSCTSTKQRLGMLFYMVESIKKQSVKPDIFYVNLSAKHDLIDEIKLMVPDLLNTDYIKINWVEDTGPYRKLIPVLDKSSSDDLIITSDDDVLYGKNWIESLVRLSEKHPDHIVCARARVIKKNVLNRWQNYSRWKLIPHEERGVLVLPTNGAGTVFRKSFFDLDFLIDPAYRTLAPTTDDLWFRMASLRINVPVYVDPIIDKENIYLSHKIGLEQINLKQFYSDNYIGKVFMHTIGRIRDYLGINATENDNAWERIVKYSSLTGYHFK